MEGVDVPTLLRRSDVIFVGDVEAVGGSEIIGGAHGVELTSHRVRLHVIRKIRGDAGPTVDVRLLDFPSTVDAFDSGREYLVFAAYRRLGNMATDSLVPEGYEQAAFAVTGARRATNPYGLSVDVEEIAREATP